MIKYILLFVPFMLTAQMDKAKHFAAGGTITAISYTLIYKKTKSHPKSLLLGMASGIIAGVAKEVYDPVFEKKDILATALGSVSVGITIDLATLSSRHRH
jgi:hypothetical protein